MKFSLIIATINRTVELERLFSTLELQTYKNFELIVVDQNTDNRLDHILSFYAKNLSVLHLKSSPGLSRARNIGIRFCSGEIVAFPDDDCWYLADLLERVRYMLDAHPEWGGLTGRAKSDSGGSAVGRWDKDAGFLTRRNVWTRGISFTIFLRRILIEQVGGFDESLGLGSDSPWKSGEETDYLLRALSLGQQIYYEPRIEIFHPAQPLIKDTNICDKGFGYGCGMGRVLRKHNYPFWFVLYQWFRPFGGMILAMLSSNIGNSRYHRAILLGRVLGWLVKE